MLPREPFSEKILYDVIAPLLQGEKKVSVKRAVHARAFPSPFHDIILRPERAAKCMTHRIGGGGGRQLFVLGPLRRVSGCSQTSTSRSHKLRLCIGSLVMFTPLRARKRSRRVNAATLFEGRLCSFFFLPLCSYFHYSLTVSLPSSFFFLPSSLCLAHMQGWWMWESGRWLICCTPHLRLAIFGLPGNPFFCACVVERGRWCRDITGSSFLLSLFSLCTMFFFFSFPLFVERGPLISVLYHHKHKCAFHLLHGCIMLFRDFESLGVFFVLWIRQRRTHRHGFIFSHMNNRPQKKQKIYQI